MKVVKRSTFGQLHEHFQLYNPRYTVYRGVSSSAYKLISTLGRVTLKTNESFKSVEKNVLNLFKERALPFLSTTPSNDWEWLGISATSWLAN